MKKAIAYYRVSTDRQGQSGLGLEAQQEAVSHYAAGEDYDVLQEFIEVESGKKNKRPQLAEALKQSKRRKATLIIAKLDRLSRNVAFIANLMESKVVFVAVDNPHLQPAEDAFIIHILAAVAQRQRQDISRWTKAALRAAKKRGVVLGRHGAEVLSKQNKQAADAFALKIQPLILRVKKQGFTTMREISEELNRRGILPYRGKAYRWHPATVCNVLMRCRKLKEDGKKSSTHKTNP